MWTRNMVNSHVCGWLTVNQNLLPAHLYYKLKNKSPAYEGFAARSFQQIANGWMVCGDHGRVPISVVFLFKNLC